VNASRLGILFVGFVCMSLVLLATLSGNFPLGYGIAVICGAGLVTVGRWRGGVPSVPWRRLSMLVVGFFILEFSPLKRGVKDLGLSPLGVTVGLWVAFAAFYAYAGDGFRLRIEKGLKRAWLIGRRLGNVTLIVNREQRRAILRGFFLVDSRPKTVSLATLDCEVYELTKTVLIHRHINATAHTAQGPITVTGTAGVEGSYQEPTGWSRVEIWGNTASGEPIPEFSVILPNAGALRLAEFIDSEREWAIKAELRLGDVKIKETVHQMLIEAGFSLETTLWHCASYEGTSVNAFDGLIAVDSSNGQVLLWERNHGQWVGSASQIDSQIAGDHLEVHINDPEYRRKNLKERRMPMLRNSSWDVLVTWDDRLRILAEQA
jgi:hypothetical protein